MKFPTKISALSAELIYLCTLVPEADSSRDYTGDIAIQPNISMSHDNFDVKVTYDVLPVPCR
jgi:hypothetical protein